MRVQMPNYEELGIDLDWYLSKMFDGYSRVLFIDDHLEDVDKYLALSRQFAIELKLRHECRLGTMELLQQGLTSTKELASKERERNIAEIALVENDAV
jgi:hypothetical protein